MPSIATETRYPLLVAQVHGSQEQMGRQLGDIVKSVGGYHPANEFYPKLVLNLIREGLPDALHSRPVEALLQRMLMGMCVYMERERSPEYLGRARAFFEALELSPRLSSTMYVMDVFQNVVSLIKRSGKSLPMFPACSTLMAWGDATHDGSMLHARNFDLPGVGVWDDAPTLVFCQPDEGLRYGYVATRGADIPGVTCFNEAGITLTMHTLFHEHVAFTGQGVIDLGHDIIREARSLDQAVEIARRQPILSSWNLAISSASEGRAIAIETTAKTVGVVEPKSDEPWLGVTNLYRHPEIRKRELRFSEALQEHCESRYQRLVTTAHAAAEGDGLDATALARLMGSNVDHYAGHTRPSGGVLAQTNTLTSLVVDPDRASVHLAIGPSPVSWGPYVTIPWHWDSRSGHQEVRAHDGRYDVLCDREQPELAGDPGLDAYASFLQASLARFSGESVEGISGKVEDAVRSSPENPSYRFMAALYAFKLARWSHAAEHLRVALANETTPFRKGQILLWASRAADVTGEAALATAYRAQLFALTHPLLDGYQKKARKDERRAFGKRRLGAISPDFIVMAAI